MQRLTRYLASLPRHTLFILIVTGVVSNWFVDPFLNDPFRVTGIHRLTTWFLLWWTGASGYFAVTAWYSYWTEHHSSRD